MRLSDPWGRKDAPLDGGARMAFLRSIAQRDAWGRLTLSNVIGAEGDSTLTPTHGFTSVGDVLAYRKMWDDYVLGIVQAHYVAAASESASAQGLTSFDYTYRGQMQPVTAPTLTSASGQTDPQVLATMSDGDARAGNYLLQRWNMDADTSDAKLVLFAGSILQNQQATVRIASQMAATLHARYPSLNFPEPPPLTLQQQVIARLQAGEYIASGVLEMLSGAGGAVLESAGKVVDVAAAAAKKTMGLLDWLPYLIAGGGIAVMMLVIWLGSRAKKVGPAGVEFDPARLPEEVTQVPPSALAPTDPGPHALIVDPYREPPPEQAKELEGMDESR